MPDPLYSIHKLITDTDRSESELIDELKCIFDTNPGVAHHTYPVIWNQHLVDQAVRYRSKEFCKLIIQQKPGTVKVTDGMGWLPFHTFWKNGDHAENSIETIEYLYELYPESIDIANFQGDYPIHIYLTRHSSWKQELLQELLQFLLVHDRGALGKPDSFGLLPLHRMAAKRRNKTLGSIQLVYNAYPDAIYVQCRGETPLDIKRRNGGRYYVVLPISA